jgi:polysaccharide export outer membrane protein
MTVSLLMHAALLAALLQAPAVAASPSAPARSATAEYRVGPGDVLEVAVPERPDLSRIPTVQNSGMIWLPVAGEVTVAGLTTGEMEQKIVVLLTAEGVPAPRVAVSVKEIQSRFVWVVGEVNRPGRIPLRGRDRLIDVLVDAGGFSGRASGEVLIRRRDGAFEDGTGERRFRFHGATPAPGDEAHLALPLKPGDVVTAGLMQYVVLRGHVARPGRYPLEGDLTLSGLVSSAGGTTKYGGREVKIKRVDPKSGEPTLLVVDLRAIQAGEQPDVVLMPDDEVSIEKRVL